MTKKESIRIKITEKKVRLESYLASEAAILKGGVKAYGIGPRSVTKYDIALSEVRKAISELESEISGLERALNGKSRRRSFATIPRDW